MKDLQSAEEILGIDDMKREAVLVPEWGGRVWVRVMSGEERDAWEFKMLHEAKRCKLAGKDFTPNNLRAQMASIVVCDKDGKSLFSSADIERLGKKSAAALDRIYEVSQRLSKVSDKDIEELKKTSEIFLKDDSGSASPKNSGVQTLNNSNEKSAPSSSPSGSPSVNLSPSEIGSKITAPV